MLKRLLRSYNTHNCKQLTKDDLFSLSNRSNGVISARQYMEFINKPSIIMQNDIFFNAKRYNQYSTHSLVEESPAFIHAMAKWLWVDYKLNNYPFFDLNILQVFTNLNNCLSVVKETMKFWQLKLTGEQFDRIRFILVPLFPLGEKKNKLSVKLDDIPGNVTIVNNIDNNPFDNVNQFSNEWKTDKQFKINKTTSDQPITWIQDPIYMIFLNDIMCYTASDIVKFNITEQKWQQRLLKFDHTGQLTQEMIYTDEMDNLCAQTITILQNCILHNDTKYFDPINGKDEMEVVIPSQLLRLLNVAKYLVPDYKLFALDKSVDRRVKHWWDNFFLKLQQQNVDLNEALVKNLLKQLYNHGPLPIRQPIDFSFLKQLVTRDAFKPMELATMSNFTKTWSDQEQTSTDRYAPYSTKSSSTFLSQLHLLRSI